MTTNLRGAVLFNSSLTQCSSRAGSVVQKLPVIPTRAQKLLIAWGGKPRRRRAVRVNKRGSSQSATKPESIKRPIFRFETYVNFIEGAISITWKKAPLPKMLVKK